MITLLPESDKKHIHVEYLLRLITVCSFLLACVFAIGAALLIPSFVLSEEKLRLITEQNASVAAELAGTNDAALRTSIRLIEAELAHISNGPRSLFEATNDILSEMPSGIELTDMTITNSASKGVRLDGVASRREALIQFRNNLNASGTFTNVTLPLSDLAASTNISFTITMSLASTTPSTP